MNKNIILLNHAKWLEKEGKIKEAKECEQQAYEDDNFRSTRNRKDNNIVKPGRSIHTRRDKT
jgi:hypothetical protein